MIIKGTPGCLSQMVKVYEEREGGNIIAVEEAPWDQVHRYGVVAPKDWQDNHFSIDAMVEKPKRDIAPSNLIISGRYILQPEIFAEIEKQKPGAGGEIQITDAMINLMQSQAFHGLRFEGKTYDCGDKVGFLAANVAFALEREDLGPAFRQVLQEVIASHNGFLSWNTNTDLSTILKELQNRPVEDAQEKIAS
jgi:UTP--glucose-1-phosphate uridylyltransferase